MKKIGGLPIPVWLAGLGLCWDSGYVRDVAVGNQKDFTVPAGGEWQILSVYVRYTADANVGNRQVAIRTIAPGPIMVDEVAIAGATQAAGELRYYHFGASAADLLGFRDTDWLMTPIHPGYIVPVGTIIRVLDRNNVSALDTLRAYINYAVRST